MTPKEKAQELVDKFREFADGTDSETDRYSPGVEKEKAKQCALIAVEEILNSILGNYEFDFLRNYWQEVKQEIEKL
jgi:hypothetical protein